MTKYLIPKDFKSHQHYKDRNPSWIKLHKSLLDDYEFQCLQVASKALAPMLWLLASECSEGKIEYDLKKICFRLRITESDFECALQPLIDNGFFILSSDPLAEAEQDACLEKRREEKNIAQKRKEEFEEFYKLYPNKKDRKKAEIAFYKTKAPLQEILLGLERYIRGKEKWKEWKLPATWLNGECWNDDYGGAKSIAKISDGLSSQERNAIRNKQAGLA